MEFLNNNKIMLCRPGSCCPIIEKVSDEEYNITDDYNGKVVITKDQLKMLKDAIEHFDDKI